QLGLIVVATIPAVILGFALEKFFRNLFGTPVVASVFLIVNGGLLFFGERLRRAGRSVRTIDGMRWRDAIYIGLWQSTALIPGISRSGATMVGGLLAGLHHEDSARFSFLIATPVIAGAAVLEVPKLLHAGSFGPVAWIAGAVAGVTAFLSVVFLMRYFKRHDFEALDPFAWYCWTFGAVSLALLLFVL
ncbi:MAG: undecaprenyl-diphosphate phosphatase, partial [Alphaproteobacteria bacterium]|nr:undecaprenyl-diphosphate phosphatase [Alphaproteobacteria bacterium]